MHKVTDFYSLKGGSEDVISNPRDVVCPMLTAVSNFYYGASLCPQYPVPTGAYTDFPPSIPCTVDEDVVDDYDSWFQLGNYIIVTNAQLDGEPAKVNGLLAWCAPNRPDVWALTELDDDTGEDVKTGAGSAQLSGAPAIVWAIGSGATGHVFSADEIGFIGLSERWYDPFTYIVIADSLGIQSKPLLFNRAIWAVLTDGRLYRIQGTGMQIASDFFDGNAAGARYDAPSTTTEVNHAYNNICINTGTEEVWVNRTTGGYGCAGGADAYITTGVIQVVPPHHRTHLVGVKVRNSYTQDGEVVAQLKATTWGTAGWGVYDSELDTDPVNISPVETFIPINRTVTEPQIKISIVSGSEPASLTIYGLAFVFEDGGPRSY